MTHNSTLPSGSNDAVDEKHAPEGQHIEAIRTISRVPGHENYYEKNGLRTYGDGEDHDEAPAVSYWFNWEARLLTRDLVDISSHYVLDSDGFPLDWIANSRLHFR